LNKTVEKVGQHLMLVGGVFGISQLKRGMSNDSTIFREWMQFGSSLTEAGAADAAEDTLTTGVFGEIDGAAKEALGEDRLGKSFKRSIRTVQSQL
jgi:hypothetical protein